MTITPNVMDIDEDHKPRYMVFSKVSTFWLDSNVLVNDVQLNRPFHLSLQRSAKKAVDHVGQG